MTTLVTGATGFLGSKICSELLARKYEVRGTVRSRSINYLLPNLRNRFCIIENIEADTDWFDAISGIDTIIHCAARAYAMNDNKEDALATYRAVNAEGTKNLAKQAIAARVRRFIYLSSIKVNGEKTALGNFFEADDLPAPEDAYGISKYEAEKVLQELASKSEMEVVIIRPPLVYGSGVKGNFETLIKVVQKGLPLPLGAIHNKRSLVSLENLVDLIIKCINHPKAANQIFLAGDGYDLSTTELLQGVAKAAGAPSRLIPVPTSVLIFAARLFGKRALAQRLLGSLQIDISKAHNLLGWIPPLTVEEGLRRCFVKKVK